MGWRAGFILVIIHFLTLTDGWLVEPHLRMKRQTVVSSNAETSGQADNVETDAMAQHYKTADGTVGMNVSSSGNATGANTATINNQAQGQVGSTMLNATGNVGASGNNSQSFSGIDAAVYGNQSYLSNQQQGSVSGTGDTQVLANGGGQVVDSSGNVLGGQQIGTAGATGSLNSSSAVTAIQNITWGEFVSQMMAEAAAHGLGNGQANIDLGSGTPTNGIEVNGLLSGWNDNNGDINANVNGAANITNGVHDLTGSMQGNATGDGHSHIVGATNLQSNVSGTNNTISMFGDSDVQTEGESAINLNSGSNMTNGNGGNGNIIVNATANGPDKNMTAQDGVKVNDQNGGTLAINYGSIQGNGTENSGGSIVVNTQYNQTGQAQLDSRADGNSISNGQNSSLQINNQADLNNTNGVDNHGMASAGGVAAGQSSNMTGTGQLTVSGSGTGGNSNMEAFAGGNGSSSAETNAALGLNDAGGPRNSSVQGSVNASGDQTSVHSISTVTDDNGVQTLNNYQHASSIAHGSSSSSASNTAILRRKREIRRRKIHRLGPLFDALF
ncbi:unnamed protein product, partial [Mesorhabditis belari]|uniref:Uncharacterized protein n=1 Tax=Mesorhabditis belari TaxID=2138241 RepID=A0AAF3EEA2_9BILA